MPKENVPRWRSLTADQLCWASSGGEEAKRASNAAHPAAVKVVLITFLLIGLADSTRPTKLPRSSTADESATQPAAKYVPFLFGTGQEQNGKVSLKIQWRRQERRHWGRAGFIAPKVRGGFETRP
jgi:hypothetical protein